MPTGPAEMGDHLARDLLHELRQRAAVGLAQHHQVGARIHRGFDGAQGVFRILAEAVKEVLRIVEHLAAVLFQ
jgi:hypothetical protein